MNNRLLLYWFGVETIATAGFRYMATLDWEHQTSNSPYDEV